MSKIFSTLFDILRAGQKTSKIVKKCQNTIFRHFSTIFPRHQFSGPFWGALKLQRQTTCGTKVRWILRNFVTNLAPNVCQLFLGVFVLHLQGNGDNWQFTKIPAMFQCQIPQPNPEKRITNIFWRVGKVRNGRKIWKCQQAAKSPKFRQPCLSRSKGRSSPGDHPQGRGTNVGAFVPVWLVLAPVWGWNSDVFDLDPFDPMKRGCVNVGVFGTRWKCHEVFLKCLKPSSLECRKHSGPESWKKNSIEIFNLALELQSRPSEFPTKKALVGGSLECFNLAWKFQSRRVILIYFFLSLGL